MKRTTRGSDIPALVQEMVKAGAVFQRSECGTWLVDGLDTLPCELRDSFFECDERGLAEELRRIEGHPTPAHPEPVA